jgi:hypothetical protein
MVRSTSRNPLDVGRLPQYRKMDRERRKDNKVKRERKRKMKREKRK